MDAVRVYPSGEDLVSRRVLHQADSRIGQGQSLIFAKDKFSGLKAAANPEESLVDGSAVLGAALAHYAAGVDDAEVGKGSDQHDDADREADVAVCNGEVGVVAAGDAVDEQRHDADERGQEEGGEAGGETHQQRRKPAEVAERNAKQDALLAGESDIMNAIHLK